MGIKFSIHVVLTRLLKQMKRRNSYNREKNVRNKIRNRNELCEEFDILASNWS